MKRSVSALFAAFIILLSGCSSLLESERLVIKPYEWDKSAENVPAGTEISSYAELKSTVKWLVDNHRESGELTFSNYDGDVREDLYRACEEVQSNTALGAYSVKYMSHVPQQILSYYRAQLNITYKRTKQEIDGIVYITGGIRDFPEAIGEMLKNAETYAAFHVISSSVNAAEIEAKINEAYLAYSVECPVRPAASVSVYPESGAERIIGVSLDYGYTGEELAAFREELAGGLAAFDMPQEEDGAALAAISAAIRLAAACRPYESETDLPGEDSSPPVNTAVSALGQGVADSEGFAMAYYAILRALGIDCEVVSGAFDREPHYWNIVQIDGESYHFDVSRLSLDGPENTCLLRDDDMSGRYFWDMEGYPVCGGQMTYAVLFPDGEPAGAGPAH